MILSSSMKTISQNTAEWNIQYFGFFDNREYFNKYIDSQTIFGNRLEASGSFNIDTMHRFEAGINYLHEFGSEISDAPLVPTIYYEFSGEKLDFSIGSFPRFYKVIYPNLMIYDTIVYFRPNIEGSFLQYNFNNAYQNLWIDWVGRQTETRNESFLAGTSGKVSFGSFFIENYFYMYHLAGTSIYDTTFHIRDNGGGTILPGFQTDTKLKFNFKLGPVFSYDRRRPDPYINKLGFFAQSEASFSRFLVRISTYFGDALDFPYGDSFYTSTRYTRIDGEVNLIKKVNIHILFQYSLHYVYFEADNAARFTVRINFNKNKALGHKK